MNKLVLTALGAFAFVFGAYAAETLETPEVMFSGIVNGYLNYAVKAPSDSNYYLEVQVKEDGESDFTTVANAKPATWRSNYNGRYIRVASDVIGDCEVRSRFVSGDDTSAWTDAITLTGYERITGTPFANTSESSGDTKFANAVDGNVFSMVDDAANPYLGYDFGTPVGISRFRYVFRLENTTRETGAQIQYADTADFSDAVTVYTVDVNTLSFTNMNEYVFEPAITSRYIRITSANSGRSSITEFQVVPVSVRYDPTITVARDNFTNFYPVITWSIPKRMKATTATVQRALSESGPWTTIASVTVADNDGYTDSTLKVGVPYYYRVNVDCTNEELEQTDGTSNVVMTRSYRRLDRDWDDLTKLFDGITVLPGTNGTVISQKAFDGDMSTCPDSGTEIYGRGPVGLDFGTNVYVAGFVTVPRSTQLGRLKATKLFSSEADDIQRVNRVERSDFVQESIANTYSYQECTSIPAEGARCWFLYCATANMRYNDFCCNVAELGFIGWTDEDIEDAGIVTPATDLASVCSSDGLAVELSWPAGLSVLNYRVERRAAGSEGEWSVLGTVGSAARSYRDTTVTPGCWEYRVAALGSDSQEVCSTTVAITYYAPGAGTGLRGAIYAPYRATANETVTGSYTPELVKDFLSPTIDLSAASGSEIIAGSAVTEKAWLKWSGSLIVPYDGTYFFYLDSTGGGRIRLNGADVVNGWASGATTALAGEVVLTAGTYPIEIDARLATAVSGVHSCQLRWGGAVDEEVIPATQLMPSAAAPRMADIGAWKFRQYGGQKLGYASGDARSFSLYGTTEEIPQNEGKYNNCLTALTRETRGYFDIQVKVQSLTGGFAGILARDTTDSFYLYGLTCDSSGNTSLMIRYGAYNSYVRTHMDWARTLTDSTVWLRLVYDPETEYFTAYYKDENATESNPVEWTQCDNWNAKSQGGEHADFGTLDVAGCFVSGPTASPRSGFKFDVLRTRGLVGQGLVIVFR